MPHKLPSLLRSRFKERVARKGWWDNLNAIYKVFGGPTFRLSVWPSKKI